MDLSKEELRSFDETEWQLFFDECDNEITDTITSYISFCENKCFQFIFIYK